MSSRSPDDVRTVHIGKDHRKGSRCHLASSYNITFTLFWREDRIGAQDCHVPGLNTKWYGMRRKLTRFIQAVHTRECAPRFSSITRLFTAVQLKKAIHAPPCVADSSRRTGPTNSGMRV